MAADAPVVELARAKVNLHLHVTGRRADGYHLLDSLAVFPDIGDRLEAAPAAELSLTIEGPFAAGLSSGEDNLVLRAARALAPDRGAALRLVKNLPVAAGIGGGSADAAAALRGLDRLWSLGRGAAALERIGAGLGADVPACVRARPVVMRGVGEALLAAPILPRFWLTLVNPGVAVSTAEIFGRRAGAFSESVDPPELPEFAALVSWLAALRNDLEGPATARHPEIAAALAALRRHAALVRMSGSGATCFGVFETRADAARTAAAIRAAHPGWWVAVARV